MSEEPSHPIESQVVLLAGAKASVSLARLSDLLAEAQTALAERAAEYEQHFEQIEASGETVFVLAEDGYWQELGDEIGLTEREIDAVARTHAAQFERDGRRMNRKEEFETTLEIRDVLAVRPAE